MEDDDQEEHDMTSVELTTGSTDSDKELAGFLFEKFQEWDTLKAPVKDSWKEIEAYRYATDTKDPRMGGSSFDHSTHIPVLSSIAEDLEAIISQTTVPHEDWFDIEPEDKSAADKEKIAKVKAYLKNRHKVRGFYKEKAKWDTDLVNYGVVFAITEYVDESDDQNIGYVGPESKRISPQDIVFNPVASSFNKTPILIRSLESLGTLESWLEKGIGKTETLNKVLNERATFTPKSHYSSSEKDQQYVPAGFGNYASYILSGFVEVIWFYGDIYNPHTRKMIKSRKIGVIDGKHIVIDEPIGTKTGRPLIRMAGFRQRTDNLWPQGPLNNLVGLNYEINHKENGKSDALDKLIMPDLVKAGDVEEVYDEETGRITYITAEGGGVQELSIPTQFFQFTLESSYLEAQSRKAARLPEDLVGFRTQGEKTLGEVHSLTEGAMRGFIHKVTAYERFLEEILEDQLVVASENVSSVLQVKGQAVDGILPFYEITNEDLQITGSLVAKGARRLARKQQVLANMTQISGTPLFELIRMHLSGKELAKEVEVLSELGGTNIVSEYAAIIEQAEAANYTNKAQQVLAGQTTNPTVQEEVLNQELQ